MYQLTEEDKKRALALSKTLGATKYAAAPPEVAPQKSSNGFLDFILPTIGSAIGGIGGSLLAPVAGTAAGGAAGGAAGKWLSNLLQGKEDQGEGVLTEGVFGALPGAGKLLKAGKGLVTGSRAAEGTGLIARAGAKLEDTGAKLMASQANLTRAQARNLGEPIAETFGKLQARTGLSKMDELLNIGREVTGREGIVSDRVAQTIRPLGVDLSDLSSVADRSIVNKGVVGAARKDLNENVLAQGIKADGGAAGSLSSVVGGEDAFKAAQFFDEAASTSRQAFKRSGDVAVKQTGLVYADIANTIKARIYNAEGGAERFLAKGGGKEQIVNDFRRNAKMAIEDGDKKLNTVYTKLADDFEKNVNNLQGARSFQKDFVQIGKIAEKTAEAENGAAAQLGGQMTGLGQFAQRPLNLLGVPLNAITPTVGGKLANYGRKLQGVESANGATQAAKGFTKGNLIKGFFAQGVPRAVLSPLVNAQGASAMSEEIDPEVMQMLSTGEGAAPVTDDASAQLAAQAAGVDPNGTSKEQIDSQIIQAAMNGDKEGMSMLIGLSQYLYPEGGGTDMSANSQKSLQANDSAAVAISQLEDMLGKTGGQENGVLANIFGGIQSAAGDVGLNDDARLFNDTAQSLVTSLAKSIGGDSGTLSDQDIARAQKMIPKLTDSKKVQAQKLANIKARLSSARESAINYGTGGASELSSVFGGM